MRPETVRRVAPLAVAVLVLLVIAGVWAVREASDSPAGAGAAGDQPPASSAPGSDGDGSTGSPGSIPASSPSVSVVPPEPPPDPATNPDPGQVEGSRFTSVDRSADDRSLDVRFYGGVPECYSYAVRAKETDREVRLTVVENRTAGDKPCIDLAVEVRKTVELAAPIGLRTVVDAETGVVVLGPLK